MVTVQLERWHMLDQVHEGVGRSHSDAFFKALLAPRESGRPTLSMSPVPEARPQGRHGGRSAPPSPLSALVGTGLVADTPFSWDLRGWEWFL